MYDNIKTGYVTGTGEIINVEVGFLPNYVKLMNLDDAGSLYPTLEYFYGIGEGYGWKTKSIVDNGTTTNKSSEKITSNGISRFAGEAPGKQLTGTIAITAASAALTGTSTEFLTELKVGDIVRVQNLTTGAYEEMEILSIASKTAATATKVASQSITTGNPIRVTGRSPGFVIGKDADMNASGEKIFYLAAK
jgi:hypothetical protein